MKKIAVILDGLSLPATQGGAVENLVQFLLDANERTPEFEFLVFTHGDSRAQEMSKEYRHSKFFFFPKNGGFRILKAIVRSLINRISPWYIGNQFITEVIHTKEIRCADIILLENSPQFSVVLKKKYPAIPIVSHLHNRYLFEGCRWGEQILASVDLHLGVSQYICREIESLAKKKLRNVHCLYNGIDTRRFAQDVSLEEKVELRKKLGIRPNDFVFLFSGRVVPHKGVFELIKAFELLVKNTGYDNLRLLILGGAGFDGSENKISCPEGVVFSGFISYSEIHKYYAIGDVAVLPSIWEEPFGLTCAEALCAGLPTIISDAGGMPEVVDENSSIVAPRGLGFDRRLASAMKRLFHERSLRADMSKAAKERGSLFSKEKYWENFVNIIQNEDFSER